VFTVLLVLAGCATWPAQLGFYVPKCWQIVLGIGAGTGGRLILRSVRWWRINAWSEISATVTGRVS